MGIAGYAIVTAIIVIGGALALRGRPANRRSNTSTGDGTVIASDGSSDRHDSQDAGSSDGGGDGGGGD